MGCKPYNATASTDRLDDLLPFGDQFVLLMGVYFAGFLCSVQVLVYLTHFVRMMFITEDPHEENAMAIDRVAGGKCTCHPSLDKRTAKCTNMCFVKTDGSWACRPACKFWDSCFVAYEQDMEKLGKSEYTVAGSIFNEKLNVSPTMSEYSTNSMRGNQTMLAVCMTSSVALSLLIGFNRLLLTRDIDKKESDLHYVVSAAYMCLAIVGLFPSAQIHKEIVYDPDQPDKKNMVRRRNYNMILCCGWKPLYTSATIHVAGSLIFLFVPMGIKLYTNRDAGSRCYEKREVFLQLLKYAMTINCLFIASTLIGPRAPCSWPLARIFKCFAGDCCCNQCLKLHYNACRPWYNCMLYLQQSWLQPKCRPFSCKNFDSTTHKYKPKAKNGEEDKDAINTRVCRKTCMMAVFFLEMVAFGFTLFVYFYIELNTFMSYKQDRFITPRFVNI